MQRLDDEQRLIRAREDFELVQRALRGKPSASKELLSRMSFVPRAIASKNAEYGRPLGPSELDDLGQDVLIAIWRRLGDYAGTGTLEAWIYRFCFLQMQSHLRKRKRRPKSLEEVSDDASELSEAQAPAAVDFELIYMALDHVGPPDADILRLKHLDDLTFEEIGEQLSVSPNTIKSRYYRGLKRMRHYMESGRTPGKRELA